MLQRCLSRFLASFVFVCGVPASADVVINSESSVCLTAQASTFDIFSGSLTCCDDDPDTSTCIFAGDPDSTVDADCEDSAIGSATATMSGSFSDATSGSQGAITVAVSGSGSAAANSDEGFDTDTQRGNPASGSAATIGIGFEILDEPTSVSISIAQSVSGGSGDGDVSVVLEQDGIEVGEFCPTCDPAISTLPTSVSQPGVYEVTATISEGAFEGPGEDFDAEPSFSVSLTLTLTLGGDSSDGEEIRWVSTTPGAYEDQFNWDPQQVPVHNSTQSDTAVFDSATVNVDTVSVSAGSATAGRWRIRGLTVDLDGDAEVFGESESEPSLIIGNAGSLFLNNLSTFSSVNAAIGDIGDGTTESDVTISGLGTVWTNSGTLSIGDGSPASVTVSDEGLLSAPGEVRVGVSATGNLTLDTEAEAEVGVLLIGFESAAGELNVRDGAQLNGTEAHIGFGSAADSRATVEFDSLDDVPSTLELTETLRVGGANGGTLEIGRNGLVRAQVVEAAPTDGTTGLINVDGDSATLVALDELKVGNQGSGTLNVTNGGSASANATVEIGFEGTGSASVNGRFAPIDGPPDPSELTSLEFIGIGSEGGSTLRIEDGGSVFAPEITIARIADETGTVEIKGGADLTSTLDAQVLTIGEEGSGTLLIEDGGLVKTDRTALASTEGSSATLTITGREAATQRRSTLIVQERTLEDQASLLLVGGPGNAQVVVSDGGSLSTEGAAIANGSVTITNGEDQQPFDEASGEGGAHWIDTGAITVGSEDGDSNLLIESGGFVRCQGLAIGGFGSALGSITIQNTDSRLISSNEITLGPVGTGLLVVEDGGFIESTSTTALALPIGVFNGQVILRGNGNGESQWDVLGDLPVGVPLSVELANLLGLDTNFQGQGRITLEDARLDVLGDLTVGEFGTLEGTGDLFVELLLVQAGGFVSVGLSPGELTVNGNFRLDSGAILAMEAEGTATGQFDVLRVTGTANIAGTLQVSFPGDYLPRTGDQLELLQADGGVTGQFSVIEFPDLEPGFQVEISTEDGNALRMTALNDAVAAAPSEGETPTACGAGACGAGAASAGAYLTLALWAVRRRRGYKEKFVERP